MTRWTVEEIEAIRLLRQQGQTAAEIAARFAVSRNTICGVIHRKLDHTTMPVKRGPRKGVASAAAQERKAEQFRADVARATPLFQQGLNDKAVAAALSCSESRVVALRRASGVVRARGRVPKIAPVLVAGENPLSRFAEGFQGQRGRVSITELAAQHCKFPVDQKGGGIRYCGLARRDDRTSYCADHAARCEKQP